MVWVFLTAPVHLHMKLVLRALLGALHKRGSLLSSDAKVLRAQLKFAVSVQAALRSHHRCSGTLVPSTAFLGPAGCEFGFFVLRGAPD